MTGRQRWPRGRNGDLPDWYGPDEPFVERTIFELWRADEELSDARQLDTRYFDWSILRKPDTLQSALARAKFGEIAPLRKLYPEIAAYINLPKRKRGSTLPKCPLATWVKCVDSAVDVVRDIYAQWQHYYGMKNRRRSRGQSTAVDVAIKCLKMQGLEVSVRAVERALWRHGRGRKKPPGGSAVPHDTSCGTADGGQKQPP